MRLFTIPLFCFFFGTASTQAAYRTLKTVDPQTGVVTYTMQDNRLGLPKNGDGCRTDNSLNSAFFGGTHVQLLLTKAVDPLRPSQPTYRMTLDFRSETWAFLSQAYFSVGGETHLFKLGDPKRDLDEDCHEWATVVVSKDFVEGLAAASFVMIRIQGRDHALDLCFNDPNRRNVNQFLGDSQ